MTGRGSAHWVSQGAFVAVEKSEVTGLKHTVPTTPPPSVGLKVGFWVFCFILYLFIMEKVAASSTLIMPFELLCEIEMRKT